MPIPDPQTFFAAVRGRISSSTAKPVGLAVAPTTNTFPYSVIYPLPDDATEGSLSDSLQAVWWSWQVTCVSNSAAGAQWMQYKVRQALQGYIPTVAGWGTTRIELVDGSGIARDDAVQPPLFYSTDRFTSLASA